MSDVAVAQKLMQEAFPVSIYGNVKAACWAAYRKLKLSTERRAIAIWRGEARRIDSSEMDTLRREKAKQDDLKTIKHLTRTADFLAQVDPSYHRETIDKLRNVASGISLQGAEEVE